MRKTALVLGLFAAAATWSMAQAATVTYKANLSAASEVPPVQTAGKGAAAVNVDTTTGAISWNAQYSGLTGPAAAAHIHCGAGPGANAGVAVPLGAGPNLPNPITGSGTMTPAQLAQLQSGQCYINIHTAANKGGEIRGQLAP